MKEQRYRILTAEEAADLTLLGVTGIEVYNGDEDGWHCSNVVDRVTDEYSATRWAEINVQVKGRRWRVGEE